MEDFVVVFEGLVRLTRLIKRSHDPFPENEYATDIPYAKQSHQASFIREERQVDSVTFENCADFINTFP